MKTAFFVCVLANLACGAAAFDVPVRAGRQLASTLVNTSMDLQEAVNKAAPGDTLELDDGVYTLSDTLTIDRDITIKAKNPGEVVIDGESNFRVVHIMSLDNNAHDRGSVVYLHGLEIKNGKSCCGDGTGQDGGGAGIGIGNKPVPYHDPFVVIESCIFDGNGVDNGPGQYNPGTGGGVCIRGDNTTVAMDNCIISNNHVGNGGGIDIRGARALSMRNCDIVNNSAQGGWGGGLSVVDWDDTPPLITMQGCNIEDNIANNGAGINLHSGKIEMTSCGVKNNGANGIRLQTQASWLVMDLCSIQDNSAYHESGANDMTEGWKDGGGIDTTGQVNINQSVISGNTAVNGGGMMVRNGNVWLTETAFGGNIAEDKDNVTQDGPDVYIQDGDVCLFPLESTPEAGSFYGSLSQVCDVVPTLEYQFSGAYEWPTTTTSAPESISSNSIALGNGDPHFRGGHGGMSDFRGRNNTWYNFLSTQNSSIALLFALDLYLWRKKQVFGSWMKAIGVTTTINASTTLNALYHVDVPFSITIKVRGETQEVRAGQSLDFDGVLVGFTSKLAFSFSDGMWEVVAKNRALPYKHLNSNKRRLDVSIHPIGDVDHDPVAAHGLLGQTYDRDDKMVIGALDDYSNPSKTIVTKAMAEGAIEGIAADYELDGPFSTKFKFSRFGLIGPVAPRNVSSLSGLVLPAVSRVIAGAVNDEMDA